MFHIALGPRHHQTSKNGQSHREKWDGWSKLLHGTRCHCFRMHRVSWTLPCQPDGYSVAESSVALTRWLICPMVRQGRDTDCDSISWRRRQQTPLEGDGGFGTNRTSSKLMTGYFCIFCPSLRAIRNLTPEEMTWLQSVSKIPTLFSTWSGVTLKPSKSLQLCLCVG
jgi:hypothetical protein